MDSQQNVQVGVFLEHPPISPLSLWERGPTEVSEVMHRPEISGRLWIHNIWTKSV
jgi:hypothetical protein